MWLTCAVALLSVSPVLAAQSGHSGSVTLDQLLATLRSVRHVEARYIERRTLQALRSPIETRGTLRFDAPARLEKASDPSANGSAERLTIDGDRLTIDRGAGASPIVLTLHEHPEIGVLVESIRATLSGDGEALRRSFETTVSGSIDEWQLVLRPRVRQDLVQWMRISGFAERVTAIDTQDADGDRSEMSVVELKR